MALENEEIQGMAPYSIWGGLSTGRPPATITPFPFRRSDQYERDKQEKAFVDFFTKYNKEQELLKKSQGRMENPEIFSSNPNRSNIQLSDAQLSELNEAKNAIKKAPNEYARKIAVSNFQNIHEQYYGKPFVFHSGVNHHQETSGKDLAIQYQSQKKNIPKSTYVDPEIENNWTEDETGDETGDEEYGPGQAGSSPLPERTTFTPPTQDLGVFVQKLRDEYEQKGRNKFEDSWWQVGDNIFNTLGILTGNGMVVNRDSDNILDWYKRDLGDTTDISTTPDNEYEIAQSDIQRMGDLDFLLANKDKLQGSLSQTTFENADDYNAFIGKLFDSVVKNQNLSSSLKDLYKGVNSPSYYERKIDEVEDVGSSNIYPDEDLTEEEKAWANKPIGMEWTGESIQNAFNSNEITSEDILRMITDGEIDPDQFTDEQLRSWGVTFD